IVGGVLQVSADVLLMATVGESGPYTVTTPGVIASVLFLVGKLLLLVALIGLYLYQAEAAGTFGLVAFLVAFIGTVLMAASDWFEVFLAPVLVDMPGFTDQVPGLVMAGFMLNFGLETLGWVLFGAATFRARVFPRAAGVLLAAAVLVPFGLPWIYVVSNSAMIWLGWIVLRESQGQPAIERISVEALLPQAQ
ncbi:MAG: hypothetical protein R3264_17200, partial [Anaerolineae bacterium]|nr:hypothetical protein [Anaerolineae bacterium]